MSTRARKPPSSQQHLTIIVELDRLAEAADRLRAAMPTALIRDFARIILGRVMKLPPPTTTTEANRRIEHLRSERWRLCAAMPHRPDPVALAHDLEQALRASAAYREACERGESVDVAAGVHARHLVSVRVARLAGADCSPNVPKRPSCK